MHFALPHLVQGIFGLSMAHDEHLLAGADEASIQALGLSQPVLAWFQQDAAVLCPDLVHETQMGPARKMTCLFQPDRAGTLACRLHLADDRGVEAAVAHRSQAGIRVSWWQSDQQAAGRLRVHQ